MRDRSESIRDEGAKALPRGRRVDSPHVRGFC